MKLPLVVMLLAFVIPSAAQNELKVPDSAGQLAALPAEIATPKTSIVEGRTSGVPLNFRTEKRDGHKRAFVLLSGAAVATTVADLELTAHCLRTNPNCREMNPLFGSHPSRARLYGTAMPITLGQIWFSNYLRKKYPERKLWIVPTFSVTAGHLAGVMSGSF